MGELRLRKALLNMIWLIIYQVTIFSCNLVLPRLIISNYGSVYNGMISSITQFLNFVSILRLGVAGATRVSLYQSLANNDIKKTSGILNATEKYMHKVGYIILIYIVVLAIVYPLYIKDSYGFLNTAILVIAIGIGIFAQYFFGITYQTLLQADQKLYIYNVIQTIATVLNTIFSVVLIMRGASIQLVKLASVFVFFLSPIVLNIYVRNKYHIDRRYPPDTQALDKKNDVMGHSIANIVHENTNMIVLTLFCDLKVVSVYSVYNLVMNGLKQIMSIFTTGIEAVFGNMWAKGEMDSLKRNLSYFEHLMCLFASVVFGTTSMLILPFVSLYTKDVTDIEYILPTYAVVIIIAQAFYCIRMPYLTLVQAAGHYKETKNGAYFEAGLNIVSSIILVQFVGIIGTAVGTLLANIFRTMQYSLYVSKNLISRSNSILVKRTLWICINIAISDIICSRYIVTSAVEDWSMWIISAIGCVLVSTLVSFIASFLFYRNDTHGLFNLIRRMMIGRRKK